MLAFDWLEWTDKIECNIFPRPARMTVQSYAARLFGNTFLNFVSNFSLEETNWVVCSWHQNISKIGYFKCTILFNICTISFLSCYDIGCTTFRNIFMVLLISELAKKWTHCAETCFFVWFWFPEGEGGSCVHAWAWFVLIVQFIY